MSSLRKRNEQSLRVRALVCAATVLMLSGCAGQTKDIAADMKASMGQLLSEVKALNAKLFARLTPLEDTGLEVRSVDNRVTVVVPDVFFEFGKSSLSAEARTAIQQVAALLQDREYRKQVISIVGYTDAVGSEAYNLGLSQKRATAVERELLFSAFREERISSVVGRGEANPVAPNTLESGDDNPEGRARNRRVEIIIGDPRLAAVN